MKTPTDQYDSSLSLRPRGRLYPQDWLILGYCALMVLLLLIAGRPLGDYLDEIGIYVGTGTAALIITKVIDPRRHRLLAFLRLCYPALFFGVFYRATGATMFLVFDGFLDWQLTTFEQFIFGVNPTLYIDRNMLNVWLSEIILFCYFCYYSMIPAFVLAVFLKRDYRELRIGLTAICLTFFLSYPLFFLYPIEGPRWYFADLYVNAIDGPVFVEFVHTVMRHGAVRGGCMLGLAIGTFWGRFHYVTDVFVGGAIAVFATMMVLKYYDRWERPPVNAERSTEMRIHHAA
jgi:hypothetical protein